MGAREDLLAVGAALAEKARAAANSGQPITYESIRVAHLAEGAKAALEAAALVDAEPAPIIAATERLHEKLAGLGEETGLDVAAQFGAAEAIDAVTEIVEEVIVTTRRRAAVGVAYARLDELCERLGQDFGAAQTETAKRIAARIHTAREEAEQAIKAATTGQEA